MGMNRRRFDHQLAGILVGLLAPLLGCVVFYYVQSAEMNGLAVEEYLKMLRIPKILGMILTWSLLANLVVFSIANRVDWLRLSQGIVYATLLYGIFIIYLKIA